MIRIESKTFEEAVAQEEAELGRPLKQWEIDCKSTWWGMAEMLDELHEEREQRKEQDREIFGSGSVPEVRRKEE